MTGFNSTWSETVF